MNSLINEFQKKIFCDNCDVTDLLRMGLVIANKLQAYEIKRWITDELYGYKKENIPDYRKIPVCLKFLNPSIGWCPIVIQDEEMIQKLREMPINSSISEIEMHGKSGKQIHMDAPVAVKKMFSRQIPFETDINYVCNSISLLNIIELVKNKLVEWVSELEQNDVIDVNMAFSDEQIEKSKLISNQIINNFYGDKGRIQLIQNMNDETDKE